MPTDTFFRLPEEKRARILEGAWSEFTAVPYAEASINRIVQTSRIPRGSFYQYFEDKKDIFVYFLQDYKREIFAGFFKVLRELSGDFMRALDTFIDDIIEESYLEPGRGFRIILSEPWIFERIWADMLNPECEDADACRAKEENRSAIDWSLLDLADEAEADIFIHILGAVIRDSLCHIFIGTEMPLEGAKKLIHERLDSLRRHYEKRVQQ